MKNSNELSEFLSDSLAREYSKRNEYMLRKCISAIATATEDISLSETSNSRKKQPYREELVTIMRNCNILTKMCFMSNYLFNLNGVENTDLNFVDVMGFMDYFRENAKNAGGNRLYFDIQGECSETVKTDAENLTYVLLMYIRRVFAKDEKVNSAVFNFDVKKNGERVEITVSNTPRIVSSKRTRRFFEDFADNHFEEICEIFCSRTKTVINLDGDDLFISLPVAEKSELKHLHAYVDENKGSSLSVYHSLISDIL